MNRLTMHVVNEEANERAVFYSMHSNHEGRMQSPAGYQDYMTNDSFTYCPIQMMHEILVTSLKRILWFYKIV